MVRRWKSPHARLLLTTGLGVMLGLLVVFAAGCGEDDPCATKTCHFGVCDSDDGQCTNREACNVDQDCIPGYLCGEDGACVAQTTCEVDGDCDVGACRDGACVNPTQCDSNEECLARTYCSRDGACAPDPCNRVNCQRGVCDRGTDNCVSADSCSEDTELQDCVAGQRCAEGACYSMENYCDNLTCDRGVCSFAEDGCINAPDCGGDDANCTEGFFCNGMDRCVQDLCQQFNVMCEEGGVCVRATGQCENAMSCGSNADCLAGHNCVDGVCLLEGRTCGDAGGDGGCPGNQTCAYNPDDLSAVCEEPDVCQTSIDCKDGRQCGGQTCLEPTTCRDDLFEPNDMSAESTVFTDVSADGLLSGTMCQGDTDIFRFTTTDIVTPTTSGTIVVDVTVPERDIGLGEMSMTLSDTDGTELGTASLGAMAQERTMRVTSSLGIPDHGEYTVELTAGGEMSSSGLAYDLSVNIVGENGLQACTDTQVVSAGQRISGTMESSQSSGLTASCISGSESTSELVYALQLDRAQELTINVNPVTSTEDVSVSVRERCSEAATEMACTNENGEDGAETIQEVFSAGTYYVVVQAPGEASLNDFEMTIERSFYTQCGPSDDYCGGPDTAWICSPDGGQYNEVTCDAGCEPSTGVCVPPAGDRCNDAPVLQDPGQEGGGGMQDRMVSKEIDLRQYTNAYQIAPGGCLDASPRTGGAEATFEVTLAPKTAVTIDAAFENNVQGALYFTDSCSGLESSCVAGAQDSVDGEAAQETLTYSNLSDQEQTRYVVVDVAADQNVGLVQMDATFEDVICTPDMNQCSMAGNVETCNPAGTAYAETANCGPWPCMTGACQRPDTCMSAINATADAKTSGGATYSDDWAPFTDDYSGNDTCSNISIDSIDTDGRESVYQVDLQANEIVSATMTGNGDFSLYIKAASDCGVLDTPCLDGDETDPGDASVSYAASSAETVYVIAERERESSGSFTLNIQVQVPICMPNTASCTSGGDVSVCGSQGLSESTITCSNCCSTIGSASSSPGSTFDDNESNPVTDTVNVSGCTGTISKVFVPVDVTHDWMGDMVLDLESPAGTVVNLHARFTGGASSFTPGIYGDDLTADGSLSDFVGESGNGTWTMHAWDELGGFSGTLNSWAVLAACN